jgi:thiopurine S-methyltransferase
MDNPWLVRWREGRIGFRYWQALGAATDAKVLVPLCGKSLDMRWLAGQGHPVLGIELASEAIEQFLAEGEGEVSRYRRGGFEIGRQHNVELWHGDFFHFHIEAAAEVGAFYDRAALIALSEATRQRYAFHLAQLLPPGSQGLLIGLTRAPGDERGPPFSVGAEEIRELFAPNFELELLEEGEPEPGSGFRESVWRLIRRGPRGD